MEIKKVRPYWIYKLLYPVDPETDYLERSRNSKITKANINIMNRIEYAMSVLSLLSMSEYFKFIQYISVGSEASSIFK